MFFKDEIQNALFAWKVCKYVKSNAIVFAASEQTLGIGAGLNSSTATSGGYKITSFTAGTGTVSIFTSFNISSIGDSGTGNYRVNFYRLNSCCINFFTYILINHFFFFNY